MYFFRCFGRAIEEVGSLSLQQTSPLNIRQVESNFTFVLFKMKEMRGIKYSYVDDVSKQRAISRRSEEGVEEMSGL